jgi:ABC-type Fe3+-hydroxamate transport system substrate-binding protein
MRKKRVKKRVKEDNYVNLFFCRFRIGYRHSAVVTSAQAAISVTDDLGHTVSLAKPAQRVISLSPHVTELIFAAGAGDKIIGTVKYSDYPAAAKGYSAHRR